MRLSYVNIIFVRAGMSELADEADSKSVDATSCGFKSHCRHIKDLRFPIGNLRSFFLRHIVFLNQQRTHPVPPGLRPPLFYLYILTLLFCNPDIIKTVKCCKVIFRCLCTADHLHASVFFEQ